MEVRRDLRELRRAHEARASTAQRQPVQARLRHLRETFPLREVRTFILFIHTILNLKFTSINNQGTGQAQADPSVSTGEDGLQVFN